MAANFPLKISGYQKRAVKKENNNVYKTRAVTAADVISEEISKMKPMK